MKKILLINPMFQKTIYSPLPYRIEQARGRYPPLGLAYLAGILLTHNYDTQIYDADLDNRGFLGLSTLLERDKPDIVGITATSFTFLQAKYSAKIVRKILPESLILIGGPHISIYPKEVLINKEFDIAVIGEGEYTIIELLKNLETNLSLDSIKGIAYRKDNKIYVNELRPPIEPLDDLPFPARSLLPNEKYFFTLGKKKPFTTIMTSRGCPFKCIFCLRASGIHFGRKYRVRSPNNILEEIEEILDEFKIKEIFFYDDVFTLDQKRIENFCKELIKRKLDISWNCRTRVDVVSPKLLRIMKRAGCERIHYGIESGDPVILKNFRKNITIPQIQRTFRWTRLSEIESFAYIMLGGPGENLTSVQKTMQLIKAINPSYVGFFITTLFPGTELYTQALEKNLIKTDIWAEFTVGKIKSQPMPYFEENYNELDLKAIQKKCYREYYFRPSYIVNKLKEINSFSKLLANIRGFSLISNIIIGSNP